MKALVVRVPPSKSILQRALLLGSLAPGRTRLALESARALGSDVEAALALAGAVGARVERRPAELAVSGVRAWSAAGALALGESATLARLATACAALCGQPGAALELAPSGSLAARSSAALFEALARAGARIEALASAGARARGAGARARGWPARIWPAPPPGAPLELRDPISSQEVTALCLALAPRSGARGFLVRGEVPSRPYLTLTARVLAAFGVELAIEPRPEGLAFELAGELRAADFSVEPDASAAAVALAAACLAGGTVRVDGLGPQSWQGDVAIARHLARFGCETALDARGLCAGGAPRHGARLDLAGEPDLAPVLAAVGAVVALRAARAGPDERERAATTLVGLATLAHKESPRVDVLARGCAALGLVVRTERASLSIAPGRAPRPAGETVELDPAGDHRMAFAFALVGLAEPGVRVLDPGSVAKSWPSFWTALEEIRAAGRA